MSEADESWAQLVSTTEQESEPVLITKNKFTIGRSKVADLSFTGNKLVSGNHCYIERDEGSGRVYIHDTSTNGTLLNLTHKLVSQRHKLAHGDEIHVVYRKGEPNLNVAYMFQDLEVLRQEELEDSEGDNTQRYSLTDELETTADTDLCLTDSDSVDREDLTGKRKLQDTDELYIATKKQKSSENQEIQSVDGNTVETPGDESEKAAEVPGSKDGAKNPEISGSKDGAKDPEISGSKDGAKDPEIPGSKDGAKDPEESKRSSADVNCDEVDAFEESLICIICQEILHDCVSCQPCMHSFCAGCYSDWMARSHECPSCRGQVERVNKNYVINNLVEAYLKQHQDKRRPEEELKALDARSKIMKDTVKPPKLRKTLSERIDEDEDDEGLSDSELEDSGQSQSDGDDPGDGGIAPPPFGGVPVAHFGFGAVNYLNPIRPPRTMCRQCVGYHGPHAAVTPGSTVSSIASKVVNKVIGLVRGKAEDTAGGSTCTGTTGTNLGEGPSTVAGGSGTAGDQLNAPPYRCKANQVHILCQCCLQPMPDRRTEASTNKAIPTQQCTLCYRIYCHMYWGCHQAACAGCMFKFKDMKLNANLFGNLILDNNYESDIFKNYVESKGEGLPDVLTRCLAKLEAGEYTCMDQARGLGANSVICYGCGVRNFKDLAYQCRKDIPVDELPAAVRNRPDCYWGKNCRTQKGKLHHAAKFNHICDQTR